MLLFDDAGKTFQLPIRGEWGGELGPDTDPNWEFLDTDPPDGSSMTHACCHVARHLRELEVPARKTRRGEEDDEEDWPEPFGGEVRLNMDIDNMVTSACGD